MVASHRALYRLVVPSGAAGERIDQFLAAHIEGFSRSFARKVVDLGGVHCEGRRTRKCGQLVQGGQRIEVHLDGLPLEPFTLGPEHILYRDQDLLCLNKPAGIDTQPTHSRYKGTLYEALLRHLQDPLRPQLKAELGMAQRLDRDTSGVLVFSIHQRAHKGLTAAVRSRDLEKIYLALVHGVPDPGVGEISSLLARGRKDNRVKSVAAGGKEAITRYRVIKSWPERGTALVRVEIPTGRSHQIRAHFAEEGHPLLGDSRYGGKATLGTLPIPRQMLHSWRLTLKHPVSGETLRFQAPLPVDLSEILRGLDGDGTLVQSLNALSAQEGGDA